MFERLLLFALQARGRGPRLGILLIVFGVVILIVFLISGLISIIGDAAFVLANLRPAIDFLGTGWGTLSSVGLAVFLIFLGVTFLRFLTPHPQQMPSAEQAAVVAGATSFPGFESFSPQTNPEDVNEELKVAKDRLEREVYQSKQRIEALQKQVQELQMMSPEEYRARQEQRRQRIEKWREEIYDFNFHKSNFSHTDTYHELIHHLQPHIRHRFESIFGKLDTLVSPFETRTQGALGDKRVLLDEVARIEKEWGLI